MRKIIEYTLVSLDGSIDVEAGGFMKYVDAEYMHDGAVQLETCSAMLLGRNMYERFSKLFTTMTAHPWAARVNAMKKYVFSSTLNKVEWNNTTLVRGNVIGSVARLREEAGGDLLIWGRTRLAETLHRHKLLDRIDLAIHPVFVGSSNNLLLRDGLDGTTRLAAVKQYSKIVKLSYEIIR